MKNISFSLLSVCTNLRTERIVLSYCKNRSSIRMKRGYACNRNDTSHFDVFSLDVDVETYDFHPSILLVEVLGEPYHAKPAQLSRVAI